MGDARRRQEQLHLHGWFFRWTIAIAFLLVFIVGPVLLGRLNFWAALGPSGRFLIAGASYEAIGLDMLRLVKKHELSGVWLFQAVLLVVGGALSLLHAFAFI